MRSLSKSAGPAALVSLVAALFAVVPPLPALAAETALAPPFGDGAVLGVIAPAGDVDPFTADLLPGEKVSVNVLAPKGSGLAPVVALVDPEGSVRPVRVRVSEGGRRVAISRWRVDMAGKWTLRISGASGTEGDYRATFSVSGGPPPGSAVVTTGSGGAPSAAVEFEGVTGARLTLRLRPLVSGAALSVGALLDPSGEPVPLAATSFLRTPDGGLEVKALRLSGGAGGYRLVFASARASEPVKVQWRVDAPPRPRGVRELSAREPAVHAPSEPKQATAGSIVRVEGEGFSPSPPPLVFVGGVAAEVRSVAADGTWVEVLVPELPVDTLAGVLVVNPDGQAARAAGFLLVPRPLPPSLATLEPASLNLGKGETAQLTVRLTGIAPEGGVAVALSSTGSIGTHPASVTVPAYATEARFSFTATLDVPAYGNLVAASGAAAVCAVSVRADPPAPPPSKDLAGWKLVQANSARSFTFPEGTVLLQGETLVLGRNATRTAFESFWGVTFPAGVLYADAADSFPVINGEETFTLLDASGNTVDGPTVGLAAGKGYARTIGRPAGHDSGWTAYDAVKGNAGPGTAPPGDGAAHGVFISEFSDANGTGNFIYEFVELHFDGNP
jgi:hypothetical protein